MTIPLTPSVRKELYQQVINTQGELTRKEYTGKDAKEIIKEAKGLILENNSSLFAGFDNTDKDLQQELLETFDEVLVKATGGGIDDNAGEYEDARKEGEMQEKIKKYDALLRVANKFLSNAEVQNNTEKTKKYEALLRVANKFLSQYQ